VEHWDFYFTQKKGEKEILHHVPPYMAWCRRQDGGPVAPSPRAAAGHLGPSRRAELPPEIGWTYIMVYLFF
jgi:hypothetical protein